MNQQRVPINAAINPELKSKFMRKLNHDIQNCLRPLQELPIWIEEDLSEIGVDLPDSARENVDMLKGFGNRINNIFQDIMTFARIGDNPDDETQDIEDVLDTIGIKDIPDGFSVQLQLSHPQLPIPRQDAEILIDALLSNAIKHHDNITGVILIGCKMVGPNIQFSVTDNGPGIPEKYHGIVFDPFSTLRRRDEIEATGLGLCSVKRIADIYGGFVRIISPGEKRGCCVVVRFPATIGTETLPN